MLNASNKPIEYRLTQVEDKSQKEARCALAVGVAALLVLGVAGALMGCGNIIKFPLKPLCIAGYATAGLGLALFSLSILCIHQARKSQKSYLKIVQKEGPEHAFLENLNIHDLIAYATHNPTNRAIIPHFIAKAKESAIPLDQLPEGILTPFLEECAQEMSNSSKQTDSEVFKSQHIIVEKIFLHSNQKALIKLTEASVKFWEKNETLLSEAINNGSFSPASISNPQVRVLYSLAKSLTNPSKK